MMKPRKSLITFDYASNGAGRTESPFAIALRHVRQRQRRRPRATSAAQAVHAEGRSTSAAVRSSREPS